MKNKTLIGISSVLVLCFGALFLFLATQRPAHDRDWELGQEKLPQILFEGNQITITNLRDFHWIGPFEAVPHYITETYALDTMETADVVISHFDSFEGLAHIFLSFGFSDGRHVSVSIETRREKGEEFSPLLGLMRQFEIIYVVGTDSDLLGVRTGPRGERVYIYPTVASPEQTRELFKKIARDVNDISQSPTFYNTLTNNCTNRVTRRVEEMSSLKFPSTYKTILPGYFDEVLYNMDLIDRRGSFQETKNKAFIDNSTAEPNDPEYATKIRSAHSSQ